MKALKDYIRTYKIGDPSSVLTILSSCKIKKGEWTDNQAKFSNYQNMDTIICDDPVVFNTVGGWAKTVADKYSAEFQVPIRGASGARYNRYSVGQKMEMHIDHIHSVFDGRYKGIPILSLVGLLNDDYSGGEFVFDLGGDIISYKLPAGSILAFPSSFPWPHEVKEVTSGIRYSWAMWCF